MNVSITHFTRFAEDAIGNGTGVIDGVTHSEILTADGDTNFAPSRQDRFVRIATDTTISVNLFNGEGMGEAILLAGTSEVFRSPGRVLSIAAVGV